MTQRTQFFLYSNNLVLSTECWRILHWCILQGTNKPSTVLPLKANKWDTQLISTFVFGTW